MLDGTWYCDGWDPNLKILHRIRATLFEGASEYQRIQVLDTHGFGRLLVIDGMPQAAESDEGVYARAVTWPPLLSWRGPTRVLVTGGGDGHVAREALRFPDVTRVVVCDIDPLVTRVTRELMPFLWGEAPSDRRLEVRHEDALVYLQGLPAAAFDVVISDITDPSGPAGSAWPRRRSSRSRTPRTTAASASSSAARSRTSARPPCTFRHSGTPRDSFTPRTTRARSACRVRR